MDHIYLQGSEAVQAAGAAMRQAASEMNRAAASIEASLFAHRQFLDQWLDRFAAALIDHEVQLHKEKTQ